MGEIEAETPQVRQEKASHEEAEIAWVEVRQTQVFKGMDVNPFFGDRPSQGCVAVCNAWPGIVERQGLQVRAVAEHAFPVFVRWSYVRRVECKFKVVKVDKVRTVRPREIDTDERYIPQTWQVIVKDDDRRPVSREVQVLHSAIVLEVVELECLETRSRSTGTEVPAGQGLAVVVAYFEMERSPTPDMGNDDFKYLLQLCPKEVATLEVFRFRDSVDNDVEELS